jgi:DNA-binding transcriptional LysR family regulator
MDVPDLRFLGGFAAIYETRNLTRAAARLRRTQPAVTYQLRQLEEALGAPLFVRDRGGMNPTALADGLHALLGRFATDLDGLRRGGDDTTRPLVVAATSAFGRHVVAPILRGPHFAEHRVHLRFPIADEVVARAAAGELDVGFVFRTVAHAALVAEPVFEATYVLIANATWRRASAAPPTSPMSRSSPTTRAST